LEALFGLGCRRNENTLLQVGFYTGLGTVLARAGWDILPTR